MRAWYVCMYSMCACAVCMYVNTRLINKSRVTGIVPVIHI